MIVRPTGKAMVAGVVGQPIAHSLSPLLHSAWIEAAGLDACYVPFSPGDRAAFRALIRGLAAAGARGVNVTLPFKGEALALADTVDPAVQAAGAANLLLFRNGAVEARNTDGVGLLAALAEVASELDLAGARVVLLGAGGAARGAAAALTAAGVGELRIVNRTLSRAQALAGRVGGSAYDTSGAAAAFEGAVVVINATSAGMAEEEAIDWPLEVLPANATVLDMRYGRSSSGFVEQARSHGLKAVDGLGMLIEQAKPSFEAFYGRPPPSDVDAERLLRETLA